MRRHSERRLDEKSEASRGRIPRLAQLSESFVVRQLTLAKMLKELEEAAVISPMLQAEFDGLPPPPAQGVSGHMAWAEDVSCFGFRLALVKVKQQMMRCLFLLTLFIFVAIPR